LVDIVFAKIADEDEVPESAHATDPTDVIQTEESLRVQRVIKDLGEALLNKVANKRIQLLMERYPACYDAEYKT
jgi:hypothetical protein